MIFELASSKDAQEVADLVNSAYRGDSSRFGWTTEADFLDGSRITASGVEELIDPPNGKVIILLREEIHGPLLACVHLEKCQIADQRGCYLGMLTVQPKLQDRGLGRLILEEAEDYARRWGATVMALSVIQLRGTLMAWYERRGYKRTEAVKPFPYDQPELGIPKLAGLSFVIFEKPLITAL